ncbi:COX15/CtaA family protein [Steroidobacter cummioxidans]|uniref:COX15/CtaA family protein n=1 Tax=Steroidobacter cummioxidans TaxID=1803913 RepID=UPI0019D43C67|nr:COX15/CtaA family protein [Steroidobacter cummioxidans]
MLLFRRVALAGVVLALVVVVLGAWVRLSAAGLGCPDWPGCYGHFTAGSAALNVDAVNEAFPHRPFEYHKAIKEMVHRYFASGLGFLILVLAGLAIRNRDDPQQPVVLPLALVGLVIFQGLLGMWTVTLLLKPLIVVLHLVGGLSTLSLLAWLAMRPPEPAPRTDNVGLRKLAIAGLAMLALQIMLGGWTSSNYAALACPDFPTCQNSYWPHMDVKDAFVLWRGLGIDYEGGVLDHPARVAIHFVHRLGAIAAALILGALSFLAWRRGTTPALRTAGILLGVVLIAQLILGPIMVMRALPLVLATAHNGVAALLLIATLRVNRLLR